MADKRTSKIIVPFEGDNSKLKKSTDESKSSLSKLNTTFSQYTGISLTAAGAIGVVSSAFKLMVSEASEAQVLMKQTEAVIKATGSAAGMTADEIVNMAESERMLTGIDDDVIQAGQNMLLTFKNIGEDTFPQATRAMEDMAVAMNSGSLEGLDLKSTAVQLGKALNDPIAGITALTKVGITFTAQQKAQIKAMMEAGDVAGAQAIIIKELNSEFGGAAKAAGDTLAGSLSKLKYQLLGYAAAAGDKAVPATKKFVDAMIALTSPIEDVSNWLAATHDNAADFINILFAGTFLQTDASRATNAYAERMQALADAYQEAERKGSTLNSGLAITSAGISDLSAQTMILDGALKGTIGKSYDEFILKNADLDTQARELYETIAELSNSEWLSEDQKKALADAKAKLQEIQGQYIANRDTYTQATAQFIIDTEMQILSQDGLTQGELDFMAQIGKTLGAYDNATAAMVSGAIDLSTAIEGGPYEATRKLYNLLAANNYFEWSVTVKEYHQIETGPLPPPPPTGPNAGYVPGGANPKPAVGYASGGMVPSSVPITWQENGSEMAIFPDGGLILPASATSQALSGGLYNTVQNIIVATNNEETNRLLEDMLEKLDELERKSFTVGELASNIAYETARQAA